jgi:hypothetical protein
MASFGQDLSILETVLADVEAFASGQPVSQTEDGYTITIQKIAGPAAPYTTISGSVFAIIFAVFGLYEEFAAGAPIQLAVKEGASWYGVTLAKAAPAAPVA